MKLLVTMKLPDSSLKFHIMPLTRSPRVEQILIVRDTRGPDIEKVEYFTPPAWMLRWAVLAAVGKLYLMIHLARKYRPDLIHGFLLIPHGVLAFVAGALTGRRTGISLLAGPVEIFILKGNIIGTYPYSRPLPEVTGTARLLLGMLRRCAYITVTGSFTRDYFTAHSIAPERIRVLPHAVDPGFSPDETEKDIDVLSMGRLVPVKNIGVFLQAIGQVKKTFPGIRVSIVGSGESEQALRQQAEELNLGQNVEFAGYRGNQPDIIQRYRRSRLVVITSEREGLPYVAVEALRCGVPVIASMCGDIADLVKTGENGILIPDHRDAAAFARAITELLQDPATRARYAEGALRSTEHLRYSGVTPAWESIFDQLTPGKIP